MLTLRPYQNTAVQAVLAALPRRPVLTMPTGAGKTVAAVAIVRAAGARVLWIAHRRELIHQAARALEAHGLDTALVMAGEPQRPAHVQVASIQTAVRRDVPAPGLIVVDECHHVRAGSYQKLLAQFPGIPVVGLTATPFRLDGRGLGDTFGEIVVACHADELCNDGTLIEPVVYAPNVPNLAGVAVRRGDYADDALAKVMAGRKLVGDIVRTWQARAAGKRTIVFAVNVAHSEQIVRGFRAAGIKAEHLDGKTPRCQRDAILFRLKTGYTTIVSNCSVLTEGWDLPALEVAVVARPTASLCLHLQTVGRIMRAAPDKLGAIVLDHAGNHLRHGMVTQRLEYSLEDAVHPQRGKPDGGAVGRRCPDCYLLVQGGSTCPECGHEFRATLPTTAPGELVELKATARERMPLPEQQRAWDRLDYRRQQFNFKPQWTHHEFERMHGFRPLVVGGEVVDPRRAGMDVKRAVHRRLQDTQRARGYKRGWVAHQYRGIFGVWPRGMEA